MAAPRRSIQRFIERRDALWADASAVIFDAKQGGWAQMPRVVPMIAGLINQLDRVNAGLLYVVLWGRDFGTGLVEVNDPVLLAFETGYARTPGRAERTFRERIEALVSMGLVRTASRGARDHAYVLLLDPHRAVVKLFAERGTDFPVGWYEHFVMRCEEIGIASGRATTPSIPLAPIPPPPPPIPLAPGPVPPAPPPIPLGLPPIPPPNPLAPSTDGSGQS